MTPKEKLRQGSLYYKLYICASAGFLSDDDRESSLKAIISKIQQEGMETSILTDKIMELHYKYGGKPNAKQKQEVIKKAKEVGVQLGGSYDLREADEPDTMTKTQRDKYTVLYKALFTYVAYGDYPGKRKRNEVVSEAIEEIRKHNVEDIELTDMIMELHGRYNGNPSEDTRSSVRKKFVRKGIDV